MLMIYYSHLMQCEKPLHSDFILLTAPFRLSSLRTLLRTFLSLESNIKSKKCPSTMRANDSPDQWISLHYLTHTRFLQLPSIQYTLLMNESIKALLWGLYSILNFTEVIYDNIFLPLLLINTFLSP